MCVVETRLGQWCLFGVWCVYVSQTASNTDVEHGEFDGRRFVGGRSYSMKSCIRLLAARPESRDSDFDVEMWKRWNVGVLDNMAVSLSDRPLCRPSSIHCPLSTRPTAARCKQDPSIGTHPRPRRPPTDGEAPICLLEDAEARVGRRALEIRSPGGRSMIKFRVPDARAAWSQIPSLDPSLCLLAFYRPEALEQA